MPDQRLYRTKRLSALVSGRRHQYSGHPLERHLSGRFRSPLPFSSRAWVTETSLPRKIRPSSRLGSGIVSGLVQ